MKIGATTHEVNVAKRVTERKIAEAIQEFQQITELNVHGVELHTIQEIQRRWNSVVDVTMDVRFG